MAELKYKVITTVKQYDKYCKMLRELVVTLPKTMAIKEEIDLLTLLVEKYDREYNIFEYTDPVHLLKSLLTEHKMKAKGLVALLNVSKSYVSEILHYKKGMSKNVIRTLAEYFKVPQESFNRPYKLIVPVKSGVRNSRVNGVKRKTVFVEKYYNNELKPKDEPCG